MGLRTTSLIALTAAGMLVAACQEEDNATTDTGTDTTQAESAEDAPPVDQTANGTAAEVEDDTSNIGAASQDATDAATDAIADGESPTTGAQDDAADAAGEEGVVGAPDLETLLTPEGFDLEQAVIAVENSDLDATQKATLTQGLVAVQDNPAARDAILTRAREALGLSPLER